MSIELGEEIPDQLYEGSSYILPEQSGGTAATAVNFKNSLKEVQELPIQVVDFNSVINQANERQNKTLTQGCLEIVLNEVKNAPHTYLYSHDKAIAERLQKLPNVFISRTSIGETSAHKVFFALLTSDDDRLRVAVKPFFTGNELDRKAITDWSNTLLARKCGLDTFQPLGFMICNGIGYTLTERQDDIDPMDNVDWSRALMMPESYKSMIDDAKKSGPALAHLNHLGIFHGDPQMKNGVLTQRGSMHWIDWEAATFINRSRDHKTPEETSLIHQKTVRDLRVLFSSLARSVSDNGVGLLQSQTPLAQSQSFNDLILTPYIDERLRLIEAEQPLKSMETYSELTAVEEEITDYIKNGRLYESLKRNRHNQ